MNRITLLLKVKENRLDSLDKINYRGKQILEEIKSLYPQIINCSYADSFEFNDAKSNPDKVKIVVFKMNNNVRNSDKLKIENWLKARLKSERIKVFYER